MVFVAGLRVTNDCACPRPSAIGRMLRIYFMQAYAVVKAQTYSLFDTLTALGIRVMREKRGVFLLFHLDI